MSLFYDDKKILAANWVLKYLSKHHCHKVSSQMREYNSYRGDVVTLKDLPKKYNYEILTQATNILSANGHINYVSQDFRIPEESKIHILEEGRQADLSSFYIKIIYKKWGKRVGWFLGIIVTVLTIYHFLNKDTSK